jgi:hypothetical protein
MADFQNMIEKERERLNKLRQDALTRRAAIDTEVADITRELSAIDAYERAKTGKKKNTAGRRSSRQDGILQLLRGNADGLSRGGILDGLGLKGNKSGEQSISNALNNMKKAGKLAVKDGKYVVA